MRSIFLLLLLVIGSVSACQNRSGVVTADGEHSNARANMPQAPDFKYIPPAVEGEVDTLIKTDSEWKDLLDDKEYYVLRQQGTERSFTGDLLQNKEAGVYTCAACGLPLFSSASKFVSGTGWPSFYEPIHPNYIEETVDLSHGMRRVEVHCARCGGHQGHVFPDGPEPTGLRYCINSVSLDFKPED